MSKKKQSLPLHHNKSNKTTSSKSGSNRFPKPQKTADQRRKNISALVFILGFIVLMVIFYLLYGNTVTDRLLFIPLANMYAWIAGKVLALIGYTNIVIGDIISSPHVFSVGVKKGCDAAEPMAIFMAGIIAFKTGIKEKLFGLATGLPILFVLNIIRIVTLYIAGIHFPNFFETMHLAVWQVIFILVAVILWFLWLQKQGRKITSSHGT